MLASVNAHNTGIIITRPSLLQRLVHKPYSTYGPGYALSRRRQIWNHPTAQPRPIDRLPPILPNGPSVRHSPFRPFMSCSESGTVSGAST
jgi:hypothetical protein